MKKHIPRRKIHVTNLKVNYRSCYREPKHNLMFMLLQILKEKNSLLIWECPWQIWKKSTRDIFWQTARDNLEKIARDTEKLPLTILKN